MFEPLQPEIAFGHFVQSFSTTSLDTFFMAITHLGNPVFWLFIAAFLYWKGEEKKSFFLACTILFAAAVVSILKFATGRVRPPATDFRVLVEEPLSVFTLPSGHSTMFASALGFYWEGIERNWRVIGLCLLVLVMLSRVYLGAHYLGDVIVGAMFGYLIGRLVQYLEEKFSAVKFDKKRIMEEAGLGAAILCAIVISVLFRPFAAGSSFAGYFAGVFALKLLGIDQKKVSGKALWIKEIIGFAILGALTYAAVEYALGPEVFFLAGAWISFILPVTWEKAGQKFFA